MTPAQTLENEKVRKCEHGSFRDIDGIAPCYQCHPEFHPSDTAAKAREIWLQIARYPNERIEGIIAAALETERMAGYADGFHDAVAMADDSAVEE